MTTHSATLIFTMFLTPIPALAGFFIGADPHVILQAAALCLSSGCVNSLWSVWVQESHTRQVSWYRVKAETATVLLFYLTFGLFGAWGMLLGVQWLFPLFTADQAVLFLFSMDLLTRIGLAFMSWKLRLRVVEV